MKKETAVEALSEYTRIVDKKVYADLKEIIEQCKQMEKEQISNAYMNSTAQFANDARIDYPKSAEQYYNETFGGNNE